MAAFDEDRVVTIRINITWLQIAAIILPFTYVMAMMRVGAIRFPYWDHLATAKQIIEYFDGSLTWQSFLEPQSQSRPLIPRLIFVSLAALTQWNIRAEYLALVATMVTTVGLLLYTVWRITADVSPHNRLAAITLVSLISCSPVGANNQIWSLMLMATFCYLNTIAAFVLIALRRTSWSANIIAAGLAWIATYSMGQGLFIFPLVIVAHQLAARERWPSRLAIFWLANMAICYALFLPGLPIGGGPPTPLHFIAFVLVYIGDPLGELIWFPFNGAIDLAYTLWINLVCGAVITVAAIFTAYRALQNAASRPSLLFLLFGGYGGACALATAWGRAFGALAVESAQLSRYSIFAACILFGLIFYYAGTARRLKQPFVAILLIFIALCFVSYFRGAVVYQISGELNVWLEKAYAPQGAPTEFDAKVFPELAPFRKMKADLYRLNIGPYKSHSIPDPG